MNSLRLSINGLYLVSEDKIYFANENKSYLLEDISPTVMIDILKENTEFSIKNKLIEINELAQFQRKITYQLLEFFDIDTKTSLMLEYENKFGSLLLESSDIDENIFTRAWDWTKEKVGGAAKWVWDKAKSAWYGVKDVWTCITGGGCGPMFEDLREALFSSVGIAIETFLTVTGIGHVGVVVVWGMLLLWDSYLLITNSPDFSWLNLIFDIMGVGGFAALSKGIRGIFGGTKIAGKGLSEIIGFGMKNPQTASFFSKFKGLISSGLTGVMNTIKSAGNFMKSKLKINWISKALDSLSNSIAKILESFGVVAKKNTLAAGVKSGIKTGTIAHGIIRGSETETGKNIINTIGGKARSALGLRSSEEQLIKSLGVATPGQFIDGIDY